MTRMLGSDAILRSLEAEGVDVMFGIPGGAILPTYDAIARGTSVRHVLARHEQGAGHMAEGYARASGKVGVAMATSGPGATNLVTPIADAWMDSTPLVCITGQVRSNLIGTDAFQETDATGITMPIVKHSWLVQDVRELPQRDQVGVPRRAHRPPRSRAGRHREGRAGGRARLLLPRRGRPARLEAADEGARAPGARGGEGDRRVAAADRLRGRRRDQRRRLGRAARARRGGAPAGGGDADGQGLPARLAPAQLRHARHARLEVRATGRSTSADLIIAIGTRFDDRVTGKVSAFAPGAKVIHFDIDAAEVGKIRHAEIPVVGPLKLALGKLTREVRRCRPSGAPTAPPGTRSSRSGAALYPYKYRRAEGVLKPQTVVETLRDIAAERRGRDLDDRRRPAPDVGDAVPRLRQAAHVHHLRRARHDGLRRARPRSARRPRGPTRPSSASTATAASR